MFEHLADLIRSSIENKSDLKGLNNIEIFSYYLRKSKFSLQEPLSEANLLLSLSVPHPQHPYTSAVTRASTALNSIEDHRAYQRPNLLQEHQALKVAGVSIG